MNGEQLERLIKAREYQKKAIMALLPDNMQGHVEAIEGEIKSMLKEGILQLLQSGEYSDNEQGSNAGRETESSAKAAVSDESGKKVSNKNKSRVKKVTVM